MSEILTKRSPALDGVRGLALVIVVVHNTAWVSGPSSQLAVKLYTAAAAAGWVGVQLFFVLSGLLITTILLNTRDSPEYFRRFFLRRALRIFPLYYVAIASTVLLAKTVATNTAWADSVSRHQWAYWAYLSNWTEPLVGGIPGLPHVWSLAVEEQFYLLWPVVLWRMPLPALRGLALAILVAAPAVRFGMLSAGMSPLSVYSFTIARADALVVGALLALCLRDAPLRTRLLRWLPAITVVVTLLLGGLILRQHGLHHDETAVLIVGQSLVALLAACLIAWTQYDDVPMGVKVGDLLNNTILRDLGKYSYGVYLVHVPLHVLLRGYFTPFVRASDGPLHLPRLVAYTLLVLTFSYVVARITWRLIEHPALRLKNRWAPPSTRVGSDTAAA